MVKDSYTSTRTCVYNINYHIVWCVKYRCRALVPEIAETLLQELHAIAVNRGIVIVEANVGDQNHVYVFVSAPPKYAVSAIVAWLKGGTARKLFHEFPDLRKKLRHGHLWNNSYFVETIGSTGEANIIRYIERQQSI